MEVVKSMCDNLNDASKFKMAKYGVSMGNAIPVITACAWELTKTNSENGVSAAIRKAIRVNKAEASNAHF